MALITIVNNLNSQSLTINPFIGDSGQATSPTSLPFRAMEVAELNEGYLLCGKGQDQYLIWPGIIYEIVPLIVRVNACGELDSLYGINGHSEVNYLNTFNNIFPSDYEITSDGSVIIAGKIEEQPLLMKVNNLGFIDSTFNNPSFSNFYELTGTTEGRYLRIDVLNDSSIICLVSLGIGFDYTRKLALIKVNQHGDIDSTYGNNGILYYSLENEIMNIYSSLRNSDGSYIVSGTIHANNFGYNNLELIKLKENILLDTLSLDTLFNNSGRLIDTTYNIFNSQLDKYSLQLHKLNNELLISTVNNIEGNTTLRFSLMDLNGNIINNFGVNGFVEFSMGEYVNGILSVSAKNNEFFASYSSIALDTSFIVKLNLLGEYSSSFNNGESLIIGDGNIHISCINETEVDLKLFGGVENNTYIKFLLFDNAVPNLTFDGNYLYSNLDSNASIIVNWYLNSTEINDSNIDRIEISSPGEYIITVEALENCRTLSDTINITTVDFKNIDSDKMIVYPNPSNDIIQVNYFQYIELIEVYDSFGRLLYNEKCYSNNVMIPVYHYKPGTYYLRINGLQNIPFIISK